MRYVIKNITRRKLRSGLTIIGIAICIAFFIVLAAISAGLKSYLFSELEEKKEGIIFLYRDGYFSPEDVVLVENVTADYFSGQRTDYSLVPTSDWPIIRVYGRGGFASYNENFYLIGVGPEGVTSYWDDYSFDKKLYAGKHLNTIGQNEPGIVLGYKLWKDYYSNRSVGDLIDIVPINVTLTSVPWYERERSLAGEGNITIVTVPRIPDVRIIGILDKAGENDYTDFNGYMPMEFLMRTFELYDEKNNSYYYPRLNILIDDATDFDFTGLEIELRENIPEIEGWDNRYELSLEWLRYMENTVSNWFLIIMAIVSVVSIIGVSNTMMMSVTERRTELGTLRALGFSSGKVKQLILIEAIILCLIAYTIAMVLGVAVADYFDERYDESLEYGEGTIFFSPTEVNAEVIGASFGIAVLFGAVASVYPAHRATKIHPVEALRND